MWLGVALVAEVDRYPHLSLLDMPEIPLLLTVVIKALKLLITSPGHQIEQHLITTPFNFGTLHMHIIKALLDKVVA